MMQLKRRILTLPRARHSDRATRGARTEARRRPQDSRERRSGGQGRQTPADPTPRPRKARESWRERRP